VLEAYQQKIDPDTSVGRARWFISTRVKVDGVELVLRAVNLWAQEMDGGDEFIKKQKFKGAAWFFQFKCKELCKRLNHEGDEQEAISAALARVREEDERERMERRADQAGKSVRAESLDH